MFILLSRLRRPHVLYLTLGLLALLCGLTLPAQAATNFVVTSTADTDGTTCAAGTPCTLRQAINAANTDANTPDTITFSSLFNSAQTIQLGSGLPSISDNVTITGPGANLLTVSGNNQGFDLLTVNSSQNLTLSGLTLTNGANGIFNNGSLTATNCAFSGNNVGIFTGSGSGSATNCTFSGNSKGIASGGSVSATNCTFSGNGSGIVIFGGSGTAQNCTFSGNGTGLGIVSGSGTAQNCTFSGNTYGLISSGSSLSLSNSIVAGNTTNDIQGTVTTDGGYNLIGTKGSGGLTNGMNGDQVGVADAKLGALANNGGPTQTLALQAGSPAIDAGNSALRYDQRGRARPVDGGSGTAKPDIGAFEYGSTANVQFGPAFVVNQTTDMDDGVCTDATCTLRDAINATNALTNGGTIAFAAPPFNSAQTITLTLGELPISNDVTINGPGANLLTVSGGGNSRVFNIASGTVVLNGLTVSGGSVTSASGGGILNAGTLTLNACAVASNTANTGNGGGIANSGTLTLNSSTVSNNTAPLTNGTTFGAGIYNNGALNISNSTISGNNNATYGGGIANASNATGPVNIASSTVAGNAAQDAGGVLNDSATAVTVSNSIIALNTGVAFGTNGNRTNVAGAFSSGGHNLISNGDGSTGFTNGANSDQVGTSAALLDPRLGNLANNGGPTPTQALLSGSPAIDAGATALTVDQRGQMRGTPDIGAFEAQPSISAVPDQRIVRGQGDSVLFTIGDVNITSPAITGVTATSDTQGVIPNSSLSITGSGANRMLTIAPTTTYGTATITLTVTAGSGAGAMTATDTFVVRVVETPSLVVTTNSDTSTDMDSLTSLREAVAYAQTFPAGQTPEVTFAPNVTGTITLNGTSINISRPSGGGITLTGPGASALSLSGNDASRIFISDGLGNVSLSGLTFTRGNDDGSDGNGGGAISVGDNRSSTSTVNITDCVFASNRASYGGAVRGRTTTHLLRCAFTNNSSYQGGAVELYANTSSAPPSSVVDCTFSGNSSFNTGALEIYTPGATLISGCTFTGNTVTGANGLAGALYLSLYNSTDTALVTDCTFSGNTAPLGEGGAINADYGKSMALVNCSFSNNTAATGGAIYQETVPMTLTGCTLNGNTAAAVSGNNTSGEGGGLYTSSATATLTNCTVSGNSAVGIGGGIYLGNVRQGPAHLDATFITVTANRCTGGAGAGGGIYLGDNDTGAITRSIVAGNSAPTNPDTRGPSAGFTSGGYNVIGNVGTSTGFHAANAATPDLTGTAAAPLDAKLAPLADNGGPTLTHALLPGSPALDFAPTVSGISTDQRGAPRPMGARDDSGAFEAQLPIIDLNGAAAGTSVTTAFTEQTPVKIAPAVTLLNPDGPTLDGASVQIGDNPDRATETLSATTTNTNINALYDATTGTLTLSGRDTLAHYAQVLASVTYNNSSDTPNTANRTVLFTVMGAQTSVAAVATITVIPINDPPTISAIAGQSTGENTPSAPIAFTVGDVDSPLSALTLSATSSNPSLVAPNNIKFAGSGANRTLTITPTANGSGSATITVSVSDGTSTTSTTFTLQVVASTQPTPVPTPPTPTPAPASNISVGFTNVGNGDILRNFPTLVGAVSETNAGPNTLLSVQISVQRQSDGKFFNGVAFSGTPTLIPATVGNGIFLLPAGTLPGSAPGQTVSDGKYNLTAVATDNNGQRASSTITLIIDHTPPTISITTPAASAVASGLTLIAGKATDATGGTGVQKILVFLIRATDGTYFNGTAFVTPPKVKGIVQAPALSITYDPKSGNYARRTGLPSAAQLTLGAYRILAVAIDGAGNRSQATRSFSVPAPASGVALSVATASVAGDSVTLRFGGALEAESASDAAHYTVEVNGKAVTVESAGYNANNHGVALGLAEGALKVGDQIVVKYSGLSDSDGHAVEGQTGPVAAR